MIIRADYLYTRRAGAPFTLAGLRSAVRTQRATVRSSSGPAAFSAETERAGSGWAQATVTRKGAACSWRREGVRPSDEACTHQSIPLNPVELALRTLLNRNKFLT